MSRKYTNVVPKSGTKMERCQEIAFQISGKGEARGRDNEKVHRPERRCRKYKVLEVVRCDLHLMDHNNSCVYSKMNQCFKMSLILAGRKTGVL